MNVQVQYEFTMIGGRGESSAAKLAEKAARIAKEYLGEGKIELEMVIRGKPVHAGQTTEHDQMYVDVTAQLTVEVG